MFLCRVPLSPFTLAPDVCVWLWLSPDWFLARRCPCVPPLLLCLQVIPTYYATFTLSCIIGAAVVYREFEGLAFRQLFLFFLGLCLAGIGVYTVSNKRDEEKGVQMREGEDVEERGEHASDGGHLPGETSSRRKRRGEEGVRLVEMDELQLSSISSQEDNEQAGNPGAGAGAGDVGLDDADAAAGPCGDAQAAGSALLQVTPVGSSSDVKGSGENGYSKIRTKEEEEEDARRGEEARRYFSVGRSDTLSRSSFVALPQTDRLFSPSFS